jgi:competence protein ComEC
VISVGADNDYGHPAPETVDGLAATGERVLRTDRDGSVAVVVHDGRLGAVVLH